jgi:hypothetical protein
MKTTTTITIKKLKYKNLSTEIQRMWNMFVIPVIIGAMEIVSKVQQDLWKQYHDNIH